MYGNDNLSNKSRDSLFCDSEHVIVSHNDPHQRWLGESFSTAPTRVLSVEESYNNNKKHYVKHIPSYTRQTSTPMLPCSLSRRKIQSPCITRFYSQINSKSSYDYSQSFDNNKEIYNASLSPNNIFLNKFVDQSSAGSTINFNLCPNNIEKKNIHKQKSLTHEASKNDNGYNIYDTTYIENKTINKNDASLTNPYINTSPSFQNSIKLGQHLNNEQVSKFPNNLDVNKKKGILINNKNCYDQYDDTVEFFYNLHKNCEISNTNCIEQNFNKSDENFFPQKKVSLRRGNLKRQLAAVDFDENYSNSQEQIEKTSKSESVVDITDHKTCALLMFKMKDKQRTVSPS
uniref:Uncharacterized protein n=1 Tax=Strongyloides venezuelensis TaxID=75913 RepID=A0A0K0FN77_STRVS